MLTARQRLDRALERFVTEVLDGNDDAALTAFIDAQAELPDLKPARAEALEWVQSERAAVDQLPADVEAGSDHQQQTALARARRSRPC